MKNNYKLTKDELIEIYEQLLIHTLGYKKAQDLIEATIRNYDPIQYAVQKANKELEKR